MIQTVKNDRFLCTIASMREFKPWTLVQPNMRVDPIGFRVDFNLSTPIYDKILVMGASFEVYGHCS